MSWRVMAFVHSCLAIAIVFTGGALMDQAQASDPRIEFELTDEPGVWFKNKSGGGSLAVATPGTEVRFTGKSNTVHTRTSLIFPTGAVNMPFDTAPRKGTDSVVLRTPGLYVFTCKIHPYMFGAVIVDDPATTGLDLGENISLVNGIQVPTASDLAVRLLRTFFIATNPANWKDYSVNTPWHVSYPAVTVRVTGGLTLTVDAAMDAFGLKNDTPKELLVNPGAAVGEVWVDTQFEKTGGKSKPGTATAIDGTTWQARRKVALPQINMNNPHNMWTDRNQNLIYQTQWFDSKLTVFNRLTGAFLNNISVGESPSHVMTRVDTDQLHVALNGSASNDSVVELAPLANGVQRRINIGRGTPHAHWMSHDGKLMVTPNAFSADSTQYSFAGDVIDAILPAGALPIATGMTPDSKFTYVGSLLNSTITVIDTQSKSVVKTINLLERYDPLGGCPGSAFYQSLPGKDCSFVGALPIQTPVSPDGKSMVTANTLSGTITVVDPATNTVVKMLPCDPGCHGVQYGAKQGGGYYAYVSSKFSNALIVVGFGPNGNAADAEIVGRLLLTSVGTTAADDAVTGNRGMGGQGILTIPVVYNGWVQNLPQSWKDQLAPSHLAPIGSNP
jgi:DNA-binding beta-propeller fold protein YncE